MTIRSETIFLGIHETQCRSGILCRMAGKPRIKGRIQVSTTRRFRPFRHSFHLDAIGASAGCQVENDRRRKRIQSQRTVNLLKATPHHNLSVRAQHSARTTHAHRSLQTPLEARFYDARIVFQQHLPLHPGGPDIQSPLDRLHRESQVPQAILQAPDTIPDQTNDTAPLSLRYPGTTALVTTHAAQSHVSVIHRRIRVAITAAA